MTPGKKITPLLMSATANVASTILCHQPQIKDTPMNQEAKGPKSQTYKVRIDKDIFDVDTPTPTARDLLFLAGKRPVEGFALYLKPKSGAPVRLELGQTIDLREPGVDRFVTLPLDQTEGLGGTRREFDLPSEDIEWLESRGLPYELVRETGVLRVVIRGWPVPEGFQCSHVDVNVRIESGYPDTQIDMAYFHPPLDRLDGRGIRSICDDLFDGRQWQRWSRHRSPANPWRPGVDNLSTHFALIDHWLVHELTKD